MKSLHCISLVLSPHQHGGSRDDHRVIFCCPPIQHEIWARRIFVENFQQRMFFDLQPYLLHNLVEITKPPHNQIFWMTYQQTFFSGMELDLTQRLFGDDPLRARLWPDDGQTMARWADDGRELAFSDRTDLIRPPSLHTPPTNAQDFTASTVNMSIFWEIL